MAEKIRARILMADDELAIRELFKKVLTDLYERWTEQDEFKELLLPAAPQVDFDVVPCMQAEQAVQEVRFSQEENKPFSVVFLDVRMPPGHDGVWAAETIRKLDPDVEIVILTAYSDIELSEIVRRVPPAEKLLFVLKPIHPQEIIQTALSLTLRWYARRLKQQVDDQLRQRSSQLQREMDEHILHQRETELRLDESQRNYRILFDEIGDAVLLLERDGHICSINRQGRQILHLSDKALPHSIHDLLPVDAFEPFLHTVQTLHEDQRLILETRFLRDNRESLEVELSLRLMKDGDDEHVLAVARDITLRKQVETAMLRHSLVFQNMDEAVILSNSEGMTIDVNPAFQNIYGYSREEVLGKKLDFINPPGTISSDEILTALRTQGYWSGELPVLKKIGTSGWTSTKVKPMRLPDGEISGYIGINTEITEQKEAYEQLKESEERYRAFVQNFQGIAYRGDLDFRPIFVHGAVEKITGYAATDFTSGKMRWPSIILQEDLPVFIRIASNFRNIPNYSDTIEYRLRRKDGTIHWMREHIQNIAVNGRPIYVQGIVIDINEMKELDLARQRAELIAERSRRLSSLGTLAGGIAHEINQPLTAMKAGVDGLLMLRSMNMDITNDQVMQTFESVSRSIQRIEGIIQHMRMLMRKSDRQPPQALHIDRVVEQALSLFEQKMTQHGIRLVRAFGSNLPMVNAHAVGLEQAVGNLLGNAIDALDAMETTDKRITVRTGTEENSVWCEIEDNGPGVPESIRELLFDPFISTKDMNRGMGLGLTIVENLVAGMSGSIRYHDLISGGAMFRILLPIADTKG